MKNYFNSSDLTKLGVQKVGKNVFIKKNCFINNFSKLYLGENIRIDDFCSFFGKSKIIIGSHTHIASYCIFNSANEIKIGKFCSISYQVSFITSSENTNGKYFTSPQVNIRFRKPISGKINIQKHSWIGIKSSILQNVKLGTGTVISAHSLVKTDTKPWSIYHGIPAIKIGNRHKKDILKLEKKYEISSHRPSFHK